MDPISNLTGTTVAGFNENVCCDVVQAVGSCSTPPPICVDVTSTPVLASLTASTTTISAASGYYCATTQSPTLLPQANQTPASTTTSTCDMPSPPLPNTDNTTGPISDNHYQLISIGPPLHPNAACYTPDTANHHTDTHQLLQQPLPYFTIFNPIPNPSPGRIYPPVDIEQDLTMSAGSTVLPRYTGLAAIDEILGQEYNAERQYNERIRQQFPERHMGFGHRLIDHRDSNLNGFGGVGPDGSPVVRAEGVGMVRRWACTGVLLLVGALPWLIAMATFIRQRNTALTGLLGLVFVFFMAVILGRLIKRGREAHWLARQERRRRQHCIHHVCSTQMLMSESPPAYEVVVKSPPPYSISCDSSSRQVPNQQDFNNRSCTVPQQLHNTSTTGPQQLQYSSDCVTTLNLQGSSYIEDGADSVPSCGNLDLRISNVDNRDPNLPSYDEAVGHT